MGVLLDTKFWARTLNEMAVLKPKLGEPISKQDAAKIHGFACSTLSTLTSDPEFSSDLQKALSLAPSQSLLDARKEPNYMEFLERFMMLERKILADAGVDSVASRDLESELREAAMGDGQYRPDQLEDMIRFLMKLACNPSAAEDPQKPLWVALWRGIKGAATVGIDAGAAAGGTVALGPAGAAAAVTLAGASVGYGAVLVRDALRGRW